MPDLKAIIDHTQVQTLLDQHFPSQVTDLTEINGGEVSRTFSFYAGEQAYIIRFNKDNMMMSNLPKEAYLYQKLAPYHVPIAPIVHTGRLGALHYAISHKVPGKRLNEHTPQEVQQILPQIFDMLHTIHSVDISETSGYGCFDYQGKTSVKSWHSCLLQIGKEEDERDYFGKWYHLFDDTFLERDLFKTLYRHMQRLLDYLPTERYLVYGSCDLSNILAQDGQITATLDWVDAQYGDFVYDIVTLDFWCPWLHVSEQFEHYCQQRQIELLPSYQQRLLCYQCYLALGAIRFYASSGNEKGYRWIRDAITQKLNASSNQAN